MRPAFGYHAKICLVELQVELRTLDGLVKDRTQCAPNGYYFIPVYDKVSIFMLSGMVDCVFLLATLPIVFQQSSF